MVFSFTISKKPNRYTPQPKLVDNDEQDQQFNGDGGPSTKAQTENENLNGKKLLLQGDPTMYGLCASAKTLALFQSTLEQLQALGPSFALNMYPNGFTISGNIEEFLNDVPHTNLIPYNSETKLILKDVEYGRLPTCIIHEGLQCKYVNGTVLCEIRDYRVFVGIPVIKEVPLKMGLENVREDMKSVSKQYSESDILKFESRVLTFLHPYLNLDPKPTLNLCGDIRMIDLDI